MPSIRSILIWGGVLAATVVPVWVAAGSEFLAYRDVVYIVAGFAGIIGMVLLLMQPLLVGGYLPGLQLGRGRQVHRWAGATLVLSVLLHVAGLWLTSPPDVIDALLFRSPTLFSAWGVLAMWALLLAGLLAGFHKRLGLLPVVWRTAHTILVVSAVIGSVAHALLIEGTMGSLSKAVLCVLVLCATLKAVFDRKVWWRFRRRV